MFSLDVKLDEDGSWLCQHTDPSGAPAPPTRLHREQTTEERSCSPTAHQRRNIRCPDCGTPWRLWGKQGVARPYIEWETEWLTSPPRYRRAPKLDIDAVIASVRERLPEMTVSQYRQYHPGDDEGVWFFQMHGTGPLHQIDSGTGMCPFLIEDDPEDLAHPNSSRQWWANTVDEAADAIVTYFREEAP